MSDHHRGLLKRSSWYMYKTKLISIIASWTELLAWLQETSRTNIIGSFTAVIIIGQWVHIWLCIAKASNAGQNGPLVCYPPESHLTLAFPIQRAMHQIPKSFARFPYILQEPHGYLLQHSNFSHLTIDNNGIKESQSPKYVCSWDFLPITLSIKIGKWWLHVQARPRIS